MNLRALRYLVALADLKHFGKAADACFVSQPTLSIQIKKMEAFLDVQLLERSNKMVMMTEAGNVITERARRVINEIDAIRETASIINNPNAGTLKLGIIPTLAPYFLPHVIPTISKAYPDLTLLLTEAKTATVTEQLKKGELDAVVLALPIPEHNFAMTELFDEEFLLAVPKDHPYVKHKTISQQDLNEQTLLLLEEGHCLRDQALEICHSANAYELAGFRATSLETLRHMVAAGVGITLIPELAVSPGDDNITYIPFSDPKPTRKIGLIWRDTSVRTDLINELAEHMKTF